MYQENLKHPKGSTVLCPVCGKLFVKIRESHSFCSNWYSPGQDDCKSIYNYERIKDKRNAEI